MNARTVEQWVCIFQTQSCSNPLEAADRILGDILGYASPRRSVEAHRWRPRDNQELANALEAYRIFKGATS